MRQALFSTSDVRRWAGLQIVSTAAQPATLAIEYGESENELLDHPYLGTELLTLPAHATAYGPKSAFRYARVRFLSAEGPIQIGSIQIDAIFYPVAYSGSFESSDPLLNRIWETGAYTAHLCMQDGIWDAPKRDRGRWAGDLDVSGRVIDNVFADRFLMEDTLTRLLDDRAPGHHVNSIPGYSALWISALDQYYLHTGSLDYLKSVHQRLVDLLATMDAEMDAGHLFADKSKDWPFIDWTADLSGDTPEARRGTQFEYILAFRDAAFLLRELGDNAAAARRDQAAAELTAAAQSHLLDPASGAFGSRWQVNSMAILSGAATPAAIPEPSWSARFSPTPRTRASASRPSRPSTTPTSSPRWQPPATARRPSTGFASTGEEWSAREQPASGRPTTPTGPRATRTSRCRPTAPPATLSRWRTAGRPAPPHG